MSYAKLLKAGQDWALGLQTINQARDNLEFFRSSWIAEHGDDEAAPANPYEALGHHNTPPIPRASVFVDIIASFGNAQAYSVSSQRCVLGVDHVDVGLWFIKMDGRLSTFWGNAFAVNAASTDVRFCKPTSYIPTTSGTPSGIYVKTLQQGLSGFELSDFSFCCHVYGYATGDGVAAAATAGNVAKPSGKFTRGPPFRRGPFQRP